MTSRHSSGMRTTQRNKTFHPAREPVRHGTGLRLEDDRVTGPISFLNPTQAHYRHDDRADIRYKWTSRNDRKGRHAVDIQPNQAAVSTKHDTPRQTSSFRSVTRNIWRMLTYFPVWDVSFDVAFVFTMGSVVWLFNAFFVFLPLVQPGSEFNNEELYGGGITAFVGVCIFELGSFLLVAEAVNEGRSGCFRWAVEQVLSCEEEGDERVQLWSSQSHCTHHHNKQNAARNRQTSGRKSDLEPQERLWVWWPSNEELRTHYIHNLGFIASFSQLLGATIFWVAGLTALPGIYNRMSQNLTIVFNWTTQVVGGIGFIIFGALFMIETQSKW